ncbi:protein hairy-like [Cataglyphis hispanica]|uniref:protein hairy-like n=1 Tax=Cataglyphis hispanica TaxID=1086592 RepID=UPI0021802667|nr:protein hairy-like [Cataglyphis hispanica]
MLNSEEEFESQTQSRMTKAELRRSNKPIMEKRRRARINQYLDELKSFILVNEKDPTRHSKLEKADILEMTVKHIQTMQRQHLSTAVSNDPVVLTKFRSGFSECATEVSRYVSRLENVDPAVKQRLVSHLNNCVSHLQQMTPFYSHYVPYMPERLYPEVKVGFQSDFQNGDENNNGSARIQIPNGVQLIPSRLPNGELAFLVPQSAGISANFPFFPPVTDSSTKTGQSNSAFTAVHRSHSPLLSPSTSTSSYGDEGHHSEHPQASSPNHNQPPRRFKLPEQSPASSSKSFSSSPETQKPQISSTSDRKSPTTTFLEPRVVDDKIAMRKDVTEDLESVNHNINSFAVHSLRQPLSVITDKTYNRASNGSLSKKDDLKRRHSDGLLAISDKRPRYQEPTSSISSMNNDAHKSTNEQSVAILAEDLPRNQNCQTPRNQNYQVPRNSNSNSDKFAMSPADPFGPNGDMWRPW